MRTDAFMLGAGIVGVSVSLHLQARGVRITRVDRRGRKRHAATRLPGARYVRIADRVCERGWFGQNLEPGRGHPDDRKTCRMLSQGRGNAKPR
ncbi:hypothetical protein C7401_12638 [Paraburkholderia unamae]|uniref:FAD-dependent oxidoreductase n=1 Tax=Paraburkholderia unamae TaxID=219649 RepID=UPI000DC47623|nr:FAD-dependent oxidoreductase [Paraburkholderia unamae]RAR53864.1 hypothetical protein C7401_12638 [Paraburkholderia unamae]